MKENNLFVVFLISFLLFSCNEKKKDNLPAIQTIAQGEIPNVCSDSKNVIHLTYGKGDSILYCYSSDEGKTFSWETCPRKRTGEDNKFVVSFALP